VRKIETGSEYIVLVTSNMVDFVLKSFAEPHQARRKRGYLNHILQAKIAVGIEMSLGLATDVGILVGSIVPP